MRNFKLKSAMLMLAMTSAMQTWAADSSLNHLLNLQQDCQAGDGLVAAFACGSVHGAVKSTYYSQNKHY